MAIDTSDFTFQGIGFVDNSGIPGCTDPTDTNYDANATINDGSCTYVVLGCMDSTAANYNPSANTDDGSCDYGMTYIPDYNFRDKLHLSHGVGDWYDTDGGEIVGVVAGKWCLTSDINTVSNLPIASSNISDLTGIEDFTALATLNCANNNLDSLDVSANLALKNFFCQQNQLTNLDVSSNLALDILYCYSNQLTSLNVSYNTALTTLVCASNQLTSLDVSHNTALTYLDCGVNELTSLDVRNANNANFTNFELRSNPNLYCINVDDPIYSAANWTNIDDQHYFAANC
tara:strand:+ start:163 stop:1026 length:864 start_codon:yes stop_codon:yes gene_type:complete